jgi:hypothetical protein
MSEDEIIVRTWAGICDKLQEQSFAEGCDERTKKSLRSASRQIRGCLITGKKQAPKSKDLEMLKRASALCYSVVSEELESMTAEADMMARLIVGGHFLKRRLNACRTRLVHAIMVIANNIEDLKEKRGGENEQGQS